jgi:hypothetical protein
MHVLIVHACNNLLNVYACKHVLIVHASKHEIRKRKKKGKKD